MRDYRHCMLPMYPLLCHGFLYHSLSSCACPASAKLPALVVDDTPSPGAGEGWDGGESQGEGSLCTNLSKSALVCVRLLDQ
jgi:hypothetical protein